MKLKKGDKIEVHWRDSTSLHGWRTEIDLDKNVYCQPCKTIGYFYKKANRTFVLSHTVESVSKDRLETQLIPLGMVEKVRKLR